MLVDPGNKKVSIIIANNNKKDYLLRCIDSLLPQTYKDIEIIVVDNASTDDSLKLLREKYPSVKIIAFDQNLYYTGAYNRGIEATNSEFILCVNNDTTLEKDYIERCIETLKKDESIGMVSGKIERSDKKTIDSTGLFLGLTRKPIERGYNEVDRDQYKEGYVFGVSGACLFLRKKMLDEIKDKHGYFDSRFKMFYEDLDLCWRANKRGWKAYYTPNAVAYHVRGGTTVNGKRVGFGIYPNLSKELKSFYIKNRYLCMKKNETLFSFAMNLPFILFYETRFWTYFIVLKIINKFKSIFT